MRSHAACCFPQRRHFSLLSVTPCFIACRMIDFDPNRLVHATTMMSDHLFWSNFAEPLQKFPIPIQISATQNIMTNAVNELEDHHFGELRTLRSFPILVSSSHPAVFPDARLSDEVSKLAAAFKVTRADMTQMQKDSIQHLFCDDPTRRKVRQRFDKALRKMNDEQETVKLKPRAISDGLRSKARAARRSSIELVSGMAAAAAAAAAAAVEATERTLKTSTQASVKAGSRPTKVTNPMLAEESGSLVEIRAEVLAEVVAAKGAAQEQLEETTEAVRSETVRVHSDMSGHVPASRNFARMRSRQQSKQRKGGGGRPLLKKGQDLAGIQASLGLGSTPLGRGSRPKMQANPLFLQDDDEGLD